MKKWFSWPVLGLIGLYKYAISPWLPMACRFTPSCSEYAQEAIATYGVFKGGWLGFRRILRCHPWGGHGHDPLV